MPFRSEIVGRWLASAYGALLVALLAFAPVAEANDDPHPAGIIVRDLVSEASALIGGATVGEEQTLSRDLVPLLEARTDVALIGRLVLGAHWRRAAPDQREEYQALFRAFMLRSLANRVRPHVGFSLDTERAFVIRGIHPAGRDDVIVASTIQPPGRPPLHVDWRLRERRGDYVIIDLVVEGVSLLITQRAEFAAVIERGGLSGLLDELRARTAASI